MPETQPPQGVSSNEKQFHHSVRLPFAAVSLVVASLCVAAWAGVVPSAFERFAFIVSGLAGVVGLAFLWLWIAPAIKHLLTRDMSVPRFLNPGGFGDAEGEGPAGGGNANALALTDRLTGLGNKARMLEKFNRLDEGRAEGQDGFTVGVMNLDGMKPINDLVGMVGGDDIIRQCAQRLAAAVEGDGVAYRCGGDEFGFIFPDVGDEKTALEKGNLLQNVLLAPFNLDGRTVRLTGSFGLMIHTPGNGGFDEAMAGIETALYFSKRRGRGRVTLYSAEIERLVHEDARIEQALRNAIAVHSVRPYFQPIISLEDGRLLGFEALARWFDPELGEISPSRFIPLAEERGIIVSLTDSLLTQAASAAAEWPGDLFLSFNISGLQLVDPETSTRLTTLAREAGLPAHRLEIEVTETAVMSDPEMAAHIIDDLHHAGVRVAMDDFGTGQSSLGRLRELKLDKVKIDRSFITAIGEDKSAEHIVRAILEMCAGLGLTVVAEGIEKVTQADTLRRYGCHAAQGYLFGKPQDALRTMSYIRDFMTQSGAQSGEHYGKPSGAGAERIAPDPVRRQLP